MTVSTFGQPGERESFAGLVIDALRGIRAPQLFAAALFGLVISAINAFTFAIALVNFSRANSLPMVLANIIVHDQIRAFVLLAAVVIADRAVDRGAPMRRAYIVAAVAGSTLGVLVSLPVTAAWQTWLTEVRWPAHFTWLHGRAYWLYMPVFHLSHWLLVGGAAVFFYADRRAALRTEARLRAAELERIRRSKSALESRLQAMQARVEPRFLFNTLAQVERLFELDPPTAARMLDDLIAYLRAAMPLMRDTSSTVAQEVELARAYLDIARLRLGDRLRVSIDVPPDAREVRMPPMMLLPLIDHAVVRGLERSSGDGTIGIVAKALGGRLRMSIVDSGAGIVPEPEGDGIRSIRQRLEALYGGDATLELHRRDDRATEAVLELPLEARERLDDPPVDAR